MFIESLTIFYFRFSHAKIQFTSSIFKQSRINLDRMIYNPLNHWFLSIDLRSNTFQKTHIKSKQFTINYITVVNGFLSKYYSLTNETTNLTVIFFLLFFKLNSQDLLLVIIHRKTIFLQLTNISVVEHLNETANSRAGCTAVQIVLCSR